MDLNWLLPIADFRARLRGLSASAVPWDEAVALAGHNLDFVKTNNLDAVARTALRDRPDGKPAKSVRLAILSSSTTTHLHPALRVAGLRRGIAVEIYENDYGQYWQELVDRSSKLHAFQPTHVLFALDAHHLTQGLDAAMTEAEAEAAIAQTVERITGCWQLAKEAFQCPVLQQAVVPAHLPLLGANEHNLPGSKYRAISALNAALRPLAAQKGACLVAIDDRVARDGLPAWFDAALWHRSKQEIRPPAAPMYGDLVLRVVAALDGRAAKCLVLDLDNTVWGGVVGDDGVEGLVLGQGSATGEAFVAFQNYALELSRRGVILAVCSKNDEANAVEPFERHPEMALKRRHIACFVANWSDKAHNIRAIAEQLNIGLDSLVFADDNPFERQLVRQELPMVAVPELSDDPTYYPQVLADAGYFEAVAVTDEDRQRSAQYQDNLQREALRASATDLASYLRGMEMRLIWRRFDDIGLSRTVQLINKTNQFNLTTQRLNEDDVRAIMADERSFGLQMRLVDRFGDNGIIGIVIGRAGVAYEVELHTWLMSCRVLGRQVEPTTLNLVASQARALSAKRLVGRYVPTKKNGMVRDHYDRLGFELVGEDAEGVRRYRLDLTSFAPVDTFIEVTEG